MNRAIAATFSAAASAADTSSPLGHAATRRGILRAIVPGLAAVAGLAGAAEMAGAAGANIIPGIGSGSGRRRRSRRDRRERRPETRVPALHLSYDVLDARLTITGDGFDPFVQVDLFASWDISLPYARTSAVTNRRGSFRAVITDICPDIAQVDAFVGGSLDPVATSTGNFGMYLCLARA
ncbi:MAG: hypothetical protein ACKOWF_18760 [Chloroflexota bacterium]